MLTARLVLAFAWIVGTVGVVVSETIWGKAIRHKAVIGILSSGFLALALFVIDRWTTGHIPKPDLQQEVSQQHIQPEMIIDSVQHGTIKSYRLTAENIGAETITNVKVAFTPSPDRDPRMVNAMLPVTTVLAPRGGKVEIRGTDSDVLSKRRQLYAMFSFSTRGAVTVLASYHFVLPQGQLITQTLAPETSFEVSGDIHRSSTSAMLDDLSLSGLCPK